ncbi:MAG: cysteine hydrolase family protein [Acidobacteriota bacterium]
MSLDANLLDRTALLLIDIQQGFYDPSWGPRNNPDAETNAGRLLAAWRDAGRTRVHVQHHSRDPQSTLHASHPGHALQNVVTPQDGEPVITKDVNSAFIGTDLEQRLRDAGIEAVVVVGLTTNHCVSTTARMAANLDFTTFVVDDATACFDLTDREGRTFDAETVHRIALVNLHREFATVVSTDEVLAAGE